MKAADVVLELLVTGSVGLLLILALGAAVGLNLELASILPDQPFSKAIAGVLALPTVYYLGIAVHHASWWFWRRLFHRRLFAKIFRNDNPRKAHKAMRELAEKAYRIGGSPLGEDPGWEGRLEWCRFAILQYASEDARREYLRQYHLYRAAYGPLSALALAFLVALWRVAYEPGSWWLPVILLAMVFLFINAAWHRGSRMWKSLCYSAYIGLDHASREAEDGISQGTLSPGAEMTRERRRTRGLKRTPDGAA
jgi:hypothetical protein